MEEIDKCVFNKTACSQLGDEFGRIVGALMPKDSESINKCCCYKAYHDSGYEDCNEPKVACKGALEKYLPYNDLKKHWIILNYCLRKKTQEKCKIAKESILWIIENIQRMRGELWNTSGCNMLAPMEPIAYCGIDAKPKPTYEIERKDLYCDTIIWQFKEMGASDSFMAQCPDAPSFQIEEL